MQIYKLFGSLQYKVVKISHTFGDFYNLAGFTYINYTKNRLPAKANSLNEMGVTPLFAMRQKSPPKNSFTKIPSYQENCIKRGIFRNAMCEKAEFT
jgi:hypothetical protein